jgi:hypothetical protein
MGQTNYSGIFLALHTTHLAGDEKVSGERPAGLLARRTRTMGMCSFDARSKGQPGALPLREVGSNRKAYALRACPRNSASRLARVGRVRKLVFLSILQ